MVRGGRHEKTCEKSILIRGKRKHKFLAKSKKKNVAIVIRISWTRERLVVVIVKSGFHFGPKTPLVLKFSTVNLLGSSEESPGGRADFFSCS